MLDGNVCCDHSAAFRNFCKEDTKMKFIKKGRNGVRGDDSKGNFPAGFLTVGFREQQN
jgi:hypothetical protein